MSGSVPALRDVVIVEAPAWRPHDERMRHPVIRAAPGAGSHERGGRNIELGELARPVGLRSRCQLA